MEVMEKTLTFDRMTLADGTTDTFKILGEMHVDYVTKSRDTTLYLPKFLDAIVMAITRPDLMVQAWLLKNGEKIVGFALTELSNSLRGLELNLTQAYIAPSARGSEAQKLTVEKFEAFARDCGCSFIVSLTRREPFDAYVRWMGRAGFKKRWIVMEKSLKEA